MSDQPPHSDDLERDVRKHIDEAIAKHGFATVMAGTYARRIAERRGYVVKKCPTYAAFVRIWPKGSTPPEPMGAFA